MQHTESVVVVYKIRKESEEMAWQWRRWQKSEYGQRKAEAGIGAGAGAGYTNLIRWCA